MAMNCREKQSLYLLDVAFPVGFGKKAAPKRNAPAKGGVTDRYIERDLCFFPLYSTGILILIVGLP